MELKTFVCSSLVTVLLLICLGQVEGKYLNVNLSPNARQNVTKTYNFQVGNRTMKLTITFTPNKDDFLNSGKRYKEIKPSLLKKDCNGVEERIEMEKGISLGVSKCSNIVLEMQKSKLTLAFAPETDETGENPPEKTFTTTVIPDAKSTPFVLTTLAPPDVDIEDDVGDWADKINPRFGGR